ncbi:MAG: integral membrane sensor signal transduction histidine kinase [Parcubacteria group bacterium Gr01-1014_18]|nr:MAG: integral membrane sensor signal transduction histidine kinase [Parcubacteria group bacterium Greene0416_36]TSC81347.1 MAG: integral membrane sensor signal transduction histidine kinase [Parcubacteria group bacterium Gr01-1014_18]TSC99467.1 MAG: integral membrane sensor signal transduction histidine kinase [Parcubacteria group bacterium Greene1014_20]TSD07614.1 MAG: integral membrane sensor signal transduction histidine kinase [Parcubacteria group bacterium Greene0714_2]
MNLVWIFSLIVSLGAFILGAIIFLYKSKKGSNSIFALLCILLGFWSFSNLLSFGSSNDIQILFWSQLTIVGPFFAGPLLFLFSTVFPVHQSISRKFLFYLFTPAFLSLLFVFSRWNISSVSSGNESLQFEPGLLYIVLFIYLMTTVSGAFYNLRLSFLQSDDTLIRSQIKLVSLGFICLTALGGGTNLISPLFFGNSQGSIWGPPVSLFLFIIFIGLAILRYRFLNIRLISVHAISFFIAFILLFQAFFSVSGLELAFRFLFFIIVSILLFFLSRSVAHEIKIKNELANLNVELSRTNRKLENLNNRLQVLDIAKSEFVSIASHQLRTPLTVMKGYLSMIGEGVFGPMSSRPLRDVMNKMTRSTDRLIDLVNDLLNVSHIESGKLDLYWEHLDVGELASSVVSDLAPRASVKKINIQLNRPSFVVGKVKSDGRKLAEVMTNLIDNAIKYSPENTVVDIFVYQKSGDVFFSVRDQGIGVDPANIERLFQKFSRMDETYVTRVEGSGLGLFVCKKLIDMFGGRIWAESRGKGHGSTFTFALKVVES